MAIAVRSAIALVIVAVLAVLWVWQCTGPDPAVTDVQLLEPEQPGDPYRVQAKLRNEGYGAGNVVITFTIRDEETGEEFQVEDTASLDEEDEINVIGEIPAPEGEYTPDVEVRYPPE